MSENIGCLGYLLKLVGIDLTKKQPTVDVTLPYKRKSIMSNAELSFYRAVLQVLPEGMSVFTKVSLKDLFYVTAKDKSERGKYFGKISQKHVDFVVCDNKSMEVVCAIELDDASHEKESRIIRDEFVNEVFSVAGVRLERVKCKSAYSLEELRGVLSGRSS